MKNIDKHPSTRYEADVNFQMPYTECEPTLNIFHDIFSERARNHATD